MTYIINAKTAKGAAGQMTRALQHTYRKIYGGRLTGPGAPFIRAEERVYRDLHSPGMPLRKYKTYTVIWEEGPYEWAILALGGLDIFRSELAGDYASFGMRPPSRPTFTRIERGRSWDWDAATSYSVLFYPD